MYTNPYSRIELFTFLQAYKRKIHVGWIVPWGSELYLWKNVSHEQKGQKLYTTLNTEYCTVIGNKILCLSFPNAHLLTYTCSVPNCSLLSSCLFVTISWCFFLLLLLLLLIFMAVCTNRVHVHSINSSISWKDDADVLLACSDIGLHKQITRQHVDEKVEMSENFSGGYVIHEKKSSFTFDLLKFGIYFI